MSTDQGYILFPRGHRDHPLFQEPDKLGAWLWIMLAAAHTARDVPAVNRPRGELVHLEPGQLTFSIRFLEDKWGWSDQKVRRFLAGLERAGLVILTTTGVAGQTTTGSTTGQTLITICNWDGIQRRDLSATTGSTTGTTTGVNHKEEIIIKQLKKNTRVAEDKEGKRLAGEEGFDLFWKAYPLKVAKQAALRAYATVIKAGLIAEPDLLAAASRYAVKVASTEKKYIKQPVGWLKDGRYDDEPNAKASQTTPLSADNLTDEQWQLYVRLFRQGSTQWPRDLGPEPGKPGCRVPPHLRSAPVQEGMPRAAATPVVRLVRQQGGAA
jgi:hypothetical protein